MIKFWKSAAKGRSGCPVRPPELCPHPSPSLPGPLVSSYTLETIFEGEPDSFHMGTKKSRLTMNLNDILYDRNTLSYFVEYMESKSAFNSVKFWLDVEYFKCSATDFLNTTKDGTRAKLRRTTSLESSIKIKNIEELTRESSTSNEPRSLPDCQATKQKRIDFSIHSADTKPIIDDAVELFKKYIALEAPSKLDLPDDIRNTIIQNICQPDGLINVDCFKIAQDVVFKQLENFHEGFTKSPLYTKAQIDILTNGSLTLDDILYNETVLFYFTEYLEQESCSILLEFIIAVTNFTENFSGSYNPDQAQDDAIILYDKYFSLQATNPIGFQTEVRLQVEQNICMEGGPLPDCFHTPFRIVHRTLSKYVKPFLESELYLKYLSEMINSVDKTWRNKSLSDCSSSEFSINTQNTLLATEDPHFRSKRRNHSVPDMSIDSSQLYNADSLWMRKRQDGLSLGRINSLGRFESKFEPNPDKKHTSVLKKMVSRLVAPSSARVDEEMAWQVAHMIVKDVTDLTMSPANSDT